MDERPAGLRVLPYGAQGALAEVEDLAAVLQLYAALRADPPNGMVELVPAARTLLVAYDDRRTSFEAVRSAIAHSWGSAQTGARTATRTREREEVLEVPVRYGGADLARVAALTGLDADEVIVRHTAGRYLSAFCGFAPGFAYLTGLDDSLHVPRRDDPRTTVPAGAVAVADEFTAIYPRDSPGGWLLVGHTDVSLWDTDRDPPALLAPGTRVRFVEAGVAHEPGDP